jgi:4-hydroxy-tetrahydrodipicolinate synthase
MLLMGCQGGTNATSGVVPEITRKIYDLCQANQIAEARTLQLQLIDLFDAMLYTTDFPEGFRAAAQLRGINFGESRQPQTDDQRQNRQKLSRQLAENLKKLGIQPANS